MKTPIAAFDPAWCTAWDALSGALLSSLTAPEPDSDEVLSLFRERARLTTAAPPADPNRSPEEAQAWLEQAVAREERIRAAGVQAQKRVSVAMESARANVRLGSRYAQLDASAASYIEGEL